MLAGLSFLQPGRSQAELNKGSFDIYINGSSFGGTAGHYNPNIGMGIGFSRLNDKRGLGYRVNVEYLDSEGDYFLDFKDHVFQRDEVESRVDSLQTITADIGGRIGNGIYGFGGISLAYVGDTFVGSKSGREGYYQRNKNSRNSFGWHGGVGAEFLFELEDIEHEIGVYVEAVFRNMQFLDGDGNLQNSGGRIGGRLRF